MGEEKPEEEKKLLVPQVVEDEPEEPEMAEMDFESFDVFGAQDVLDIGHGVPIFKEFTHEDFALMTLRAELHFMAHSFGKDVDDPDRTGVHLDHLQFYYQRYYSRPLN